MAGGEGTRLRPITCSKPKPMLDIMGRPIMEYIIDLLKSNNITNIAVTLQYMPQSIMDHFGDGSNFGVNLEYFVEQTPLGTAGSVKNAQSFFDDDFIIISGDCLTDIDLKKAIDFHTQKKSISTLVLTSVENPLEYGVVVTDKDGRIVRFLEKPSWSEVFSDTVNTGIYIINPDILNLFPKNKKFDFSKDLFPMLLEKKDPIFGYVGEGYWCDIGDLNAYTKCHKDILDKEVSLQVNVPMNKSGIYVHENAVIEPNALVVPPSYIGDGARIFSGAKVLQHSVIGEDCKLNEGASIKQSVLHKNVTIGNQAQIRGCAISDNVMVGAFSSVYEGAVIGENTIIEDMCEIKSGIKIWPQKVITSGTILNSNLVWGSSFSRKLFGENGITGEINVDITPEYATRLGATLGGMLKGGRIGIGYNEGPALLMLKNAFISGLLSAGSEVYDFDVQTLPITRAGVPFYALDAGVHLSISGCVDYPCRLKIHFIDKTGTDMSRETERKLEMLFIREDFTRCEMDDIKNVTVLRDYNLYYLREVANSCKNANITTPIALDSESTLALSLTKTLLSEIGIQISSPLNNRNVITAYIDENGERVSFFDENGVMVTDQQFIALICMIILKLKMADKVVAPISYPVVLEELASKYSGHVLRCKTNRQDIMNTLKKNGLDNQFKMMYDANYAILTIFKFLHDEDKRLCDVIETIPAFYIHEQEVECGFASKGKVIRMLSEDETQGKIDLSEGVKIINNDGWVLVIPHKERAVCRIIAEGSTTEFASELTDIYAKKVRKIASEKNRAIQK